VGGTIGTGGGAVGLLTVGEGCELEDLSLGAEEAIDEARDPGCNVLYAALVLELAWLAGDPSKTFSRCSDSRSFPCGLGFTRMVSSMVNPGTSNFDFRSDLADFFPLPS
jgi:hypothetical protein